MAFVLLGFQGLGCRTQGSYGARIVRIPEYGIPGIVYLEGETLRNSVTHDCKLYMYIHIYIYIYIYILGMRKHGMRTLRNSNRNDLNIPTLNP